MRASNRRVLDASARIDSPKDRKAKLQCQTILKCDSPRMGALLSSIKMALRFWLQVNSNSLRRGSPRQPRIRWDLQSRTTIPAFGRRSSMRRRHSVKRRLFQGPGESTATAGLGPEAKRRRKLYLCFHRRSLRNDTVLGEAPQRDEKFPRQGHDHDLRHAAFRPSYPLTEPFRQRAV